MKTIRVLILFSFVLIGFNSNAQMPLSEWQKFANEVDKPFPSRMFFRSEKTGASCSVEVMRMVINGKGEFYLLTELTELPQGPNGPSLIGTFQSGKKTKIMYANPCLTSDQICNNKFRLDYQTAYEFINYLAEGLDKNLKNESAFIYAMKKQNWY